MHSRQTEFVEQLGDGDCQVVWGAARALRLAGRVAVAGRSMAITSRSTARASAIGASCAGRTPGRAQQNEWFTPSSALVGQARRTTGRELRHR
jgi:hypothetical protein